MESVLKYQITKVYVFNLEFDHYDVLNLYGMAVHWYYDMILLCKKLKSETQIRDAPIGDRLRSGKLRHTRISEAQS
jgi:hypothetical protein